MAWVEIKKLRGQFCMVGRAEGEAHRRAAACARWASLRSTRPTILAAQRRGVTLVEMLVTLAVLLLMMVAIVKIFQAATGALNAAQVYQELDNQLRLADLTIRSDLSGVTCKMTPPNDPKNNGGYFEYVENEFADVQGEDSDDALRFTAKAPAGQPFTGRMWVRAAYLGTSANGTYQQVQPITITSDYAEIIYFLRNGNLYRRVLLVAPELQSSIEPAVRNVNPNLNPPNGAGFFPSALGGDPVNLVGNQVSWQGVNDLSAHPATMGAPFSGNSVILNTLGDLTNRENRWPSPRFANDFEDINGNLLSYGDGLIDDVNGDNVPDFYPTLYPQIFNYQSGAAGQLIFEPNYLNFTRQTTALDTMAFPFVYPGAYSCPQVLSGGAQNPGPYGWIHSPNPQVYSLSANANIAYDTNPLAYLQGINHNPTDVGDNLPTPSGGLTFDQQTWWGFPTWRETLSPFWTDPTLQVNFTPAQPFGLTPRPATLAPVNDSLNTPPLPYGVELLPPMTGNWRVKPQLYTDGYGANTGFFTAAGTLWSQYSYEDDLLMTGVRSFDIKAYDNTLAGYADLGWGDDLRYYPLSNVNPYNQNPHNQTTLPFLTGTPNPTLVGNPGFTGLTPYIYWNNQLFDLINQTFAHEGRMPPLTADNRYDAQYGPAVNYLPSNSSYLPGNNPGNYSGNIGDDQNTVIRLRRVWDSWSTEYTQAPGTGVYPTGFIAGPPSQTPPIYPSYPPPYPAPLRGIQIQIRVTAPTNQRIKTLTIRQDFTDKL